MLAFISLIFTIDSKFAKDLELCIRSTAQTAVDSLGSSSSYWGSSCIDTTTKVW